MQRKKKLLVSSNSLISKNLKNGWLLSQGVGKKFEKVTFSRVFAEPLHYHWVTYVFWDPVILLDWELKVYYSMYHNVARTKVIASLKVLARALKIFDAYSNFGACAKFGTSAKFGAKGQQISKAIFAILNSPTEWIKKNVPQHRSNQGYSLPQSACSSSKNFWSLFKFWSLCEIWTFYKIWS